MPLDAYGATNAEIKTVEYAQDLEIHDCMAKAGLEFPVIDRRQIPEEPYPVFGIWSEQNAARYGYEAPPSTPEEEALQASNASNQSESWYSTFYSCASPEVKALSVDQPTVAERAAFDTGVEGSDSPAVRTVKNEWGKCLSKSGVTLPTDGWMPPEAAGVDKATEIKVALIDVRCKKKTNLVRRLANIDAGAQVKVIKEKQAALVKQRQQISEAVDKARIIITKHGG